jgi:prevent-host-death family protein
LNPHFVTILVVGRGANCDHGLTIIHRRAILLHIRGLSVKEIAISKFKATCLAVLENVRTTGEPVLVTRFGHPVARIEPPSPVKRIELGTGVGTVTIRGDIVGPISDISDWEAARDASEDDLQK